MMTTEETTKIVNLLTPRAVVHVMGRGHIVKMQYFFSFFLHRAWIIQIKYIAMMTREGSAKIVNFMTHGAKYLMIKCGYISHYCWINIIFYSVYGTLIIMLLSYATVEFYLLNDEAADMQIWDLLTRIQCRVSDTPVTIKNCGPFCFNGRLKVCLSISTESFSTKCGTSLGDRNSSLFKW